MVDLDELDEDDMAFLRTTIRKHRDETGSTVAARSSATGGTRSTRFVKVMPQDYKRVLEAARVAEERGINVDEAIMAASHG